MKQKEELRREKEAAKLRAAKERAISRRIAKESMELIDDERLELMELAASSKGLPSVLSLDYETLQNLELYRGRYMFYIVEMNTCLFEKLDMNMFLLYLLCCLLFALLKFKEICTKWLFCYCFQQFDKEFSNINIFLLV